MTLVVLCFRISLYAACGLVGLSNAYAACKLNAHPLTPAMKNDLLQKPEIILNEDTSGMRGNRELSVSISQFAAADPAVTQAIIKSIVMTATPQQRMAIGKGLYIAVTFCRGIDAAISSRIESVVKSIGDKDVTLAYLLAANLSDPSTRNSHSQILTGVASTKPSTRAQGMIGEPSPTNPFGPPGAWP
jgi:hypothetical protein